MTVKCAQSGAFFVYVKTAADYVICCGFCFPKIQLLSVVIVFVLVVVFVLVLIFVVIFVLVVVFVFKLIFVSVFVI